ncbi:MAG: putative sugar O-methyltransferase [Microcoleus sp. PH2017_40_RAT_O_B]|jgi:putative sugar O-methyltransferase|uniref:putative sugar O-methyltransferase n=1 Tax=unclassified Microcoleus TaxID=2642155 RepID=UPI001D31B409|nr:MULTISPECIES: putative sugar O-methyltransferase [unclassified Microcoleus]MCC3571005.1 putative sugar O-methyltransferase [Microcoleus sp. PH2017_34_RAT_O_A]MCC3608616.1 putative sugar O-methyltransferase [Microcoleus sp. PH2017_40_RAT_O_B]
MSSKYKILTADDKKFLMKRSKIASFHQNAMVSSEWKKYLEIKSLDDLSVTRLDNLANPESGLTYGFYGRTTDEKMPLSYKIYHENPIYQKILQIGEPDVGNPPKQFECDNQIVSGNFLRQVYFAFKLLENTKTEPHVILEFGGGYGLLAYIWKKLFTKSKIIIVDIPECLMLQYNFLRKALPEMEIGYLSNDDSEGVNLENNHPEEYADITLVECNAINSLSVTPNVVLALASFQEMTIDVVDNYVQWTEQQIDRDGYLFIYSCHGLDPLGYQSPADVKLDDRWQVASCEQSTLVDNNYHHLQLIYQRADKAVIVESDESRITLLRNYYQALSEKNISKMQQYQSLIVRKKNDEKG